MARRLVVVSVTAALLLVLPMGVVAGSASPARDSTQSPAARVQRIVPDTPTGVVTLGDSYSSGLGATDHADRDDRDADDADECGGTAPQAWGMLIFHNDVPPADRLSLACSGTGIAEVYDQLEELEELDDHGGGAGGRLITLTVGGNDIGFADELTNCYIPLVSCAGRESALLAEAAALVDPLTQLYLDIQAAAPGDMLVVGGYPLLVPDPDVRADCRALTPLLTTAERQMIRRVGAALNDAIDEAAAAAGVRSAGTELEELFDGHEACANGPDDWLNGLKLSWPRASSENVGFDARWDLLGSFVQDSFHPNTNGQVAYAEAFTRMWTAS